MANIKFNFIGKHKDIEQALVDIADGKLDKFDKEYDTLNEAITVQRVLCDLRARHLENDNIQSVIIARRKNVIHLVRSGASKND